MFLFTPLHACMHTKSLQLCLTLCYTMDCSPAGTSAMEILQARILEWVAMPSSRDLPTPGIEPRSPTLQADSLPPEPPRKPPKNSLICKLYISICHTSHSMHLIGQSWKKEQGNFMHFQLWKTKLVFCQVKTSKLISISSVYIYRYFIK